MTSTPRTPDHQRRSPSMSFNLPFPGIPRPISFMLPYPVPRQRIPKLHLIPPTPEHPFISPTRFSNQRRTEGVFQGRPAQPRTVTPPKTWSYKPYTRKQPAQTPVKPRPYGKENAETSAVISSTRRRSAAVLADALLDECSGRKTSTPTLDVSLSASELEFYSSARWQDIRHAAVFGSPSQSREDDFAKPSAGVLQSAHRRAEAPSASLPQRPRWTAPPPSPSSVHHPPASDSPGERQRRRHHHRSAERAVTGIGRGPLTERIGALWSRGAAVSMQARRVGGPEMIEKGGREDREEPVMFIIGDSDDEEEDTWEDCPL